MFRTLLFVSTFLAAWPAAAELHTTRHPAVIGDWDGDGFTDMFRYVETRDTTTGEIDPPAAGTDDHPWSGVYYFDGWCQCWDEMPVLWGTGYTVEALLESTPMGEPRLHATRELGGVVYHAVLMGDGFGYLTTDTAGYEPPMATFLLQQFAPVGWVDNYTYGSNCNPCLPGEDPPHANYGYSWEVLVTPAEEIVSMQVERICVRVRPVDSGAAFGAGIEAFCTPVYWELPSADNKHQFTYDGGGSGSLRWRPVDWQGSPLADAWCDLSLGSMLEWQADAYHRGGKTTTTGWTTFRIFGCANDG